MEELVRQGEYLRVVVGEIGFALFYFSLLRRAHMTHAFLMIQGFDKAD
jgi:hypothetical protein